MARNGLLLHFHVVDASGKTLDIQTAMIDVLRWEKEHQGASWATDVTVTGTLHFAWIAAKRLGLLSGTDNMDVNGWCAGIQDYRVLDEDDEASQIPEDSEQGYPMDPTQ